MENIKNNIKKKIETILYKLEQLKDITKNIYGYEDIINSFYYEYEIRFNNIESLDKLDLKEIQELYKKICKDDKKIKDIILEIMMIAENRLQIKAIKNI